MSRWITRPKIINNPKLRLFCFPYAGSSAMVTYKFLVDALPDNVEVCPVEFPGRGARMTEALIDDIELVVNDLKKSFENFKDVPFAFLGHSMGALVSYELSLKLKKDNLQMPYKLYLSAHRGPQLARCGKIMHTLNSEDFLDELVAMNGIAKELLEHKELLDLMLPIIRNDYKLCETYKYSNNVKLDIPFHVFGGDLDKDINHESLTAWEQLTEHSFDLDIIHGDHFFIIKEKETFLERFIPLIEKDILYHDKLKLE